MTDVLIPAPGSRAITSPTTITGTLLVGQVLAGDTWVDHPLELAGDSAQVLVGAVILVGATGYLDLPQESAEVLVTDEETIPVHVTGMLDLPRETAEVLASRNQTVVTTTGDLELADSTATVYVERNVTVVAVDLPLELAECETKLTVEVVLRIAVDAVIPLELDGDEGVRINPVLIPFDCLPLDLKLSICDQLDLAALARESIDLEQLVCLHQGDEWTILNTFKSGERVLQGGGDGIFLTPLAPAEVLDLEPVGCDDR